MENLVKIREYDVPMDDSRAILVAVPVVWLRDNTKPGNKLGLYESPKTHWLVIKPIENKPESGGLKNEKTTNPTTD